MNKEETTFKIRTDKQLERLNYLLCFKSKSAIAEILIDTEEIIDKVRNYIKENLMWAVGSEELLEMLGGKK